MKYLKKIRFSFGLVKVDSVWWIILGHQTECPVKIFTISYSLKVYCLHINLIPYDKKKFRIILLILDFKLGTVDNQKDYLQTWENSFSLFIFIFFIKTGIQDFLLDIYFAYKSFVWTAAIGLEVSASNNIVSILPLY
jgi:hypothetical protein